MSTSDYARIASAIAYIQANINAQPELADIARQGTFKPYHFQRLFTAGRVPRLSGFAGINSGAGQTSAEPKLFYFRYRCTFGLKQPSTLTRSFCANRRYYTRRI